MAVVENGSQGAVVNSGGAGGDQNHQQDQPKNDGNNNINLMVDSDGLYMKVHPFQAHLSNNHHVSSQVPQPLDDHQSMKNGGSGDVEVNDDDDDGGGGGDEAFKSEMRELEEMFSKLNPMAEEFVPLSLAKNGGLFPNSTNPGRRVYIFLLKLLSLFLDFSLSYYSVFCLFI